jgi:FlaA1/EpsC-like NDP-sugar epimerase
MNTVSKFAGWLDRRLVIRRLTVVIAHIAIYVAAYLGAYLVRFDFEVPSLFGPEALLGLAIIIVLKTASGFAFKLYGGILQYASIRTLINVIKAMSISSLGFMIVVVLLGFDRIPRSVIVVDWIGSIIMVGGFRLVLRLAREAFSSLPLEEGGRRRVAIVGAGDAGESLAREIQRLYRFRYDLVGFFDDDTRKHGLRLHDVKVLGPISSLCEQVPRHGIEEVIIAVPTAGGGAMREIVDKCKAAGVHPRTVPGFDQLIDGRVTVSQIRDVAIEDLLGREPVVLEEGLIRGLVHNKCVLVTGAGGSIGSELCRQIAGYWPRKLILVEQSEPALFRVHRELERSHENVFTVPVIADVTDEKRMERVFAEHSPAVIFHAAAHKHVPMMELNPGEAVKNNVFGTRTAADLANRFGAEAFVLISTDKAVNPTSVMGASKRLCEMYVQALSDHSKTKFTAVRFGNVLGSAGSVVPIFKEQIARGGPVTVTDPEMKRYFMTIPEACQLVMEAAAMGAGGEIFVLDMGEPVKIVDLARDLITFSGFRPGEDIQIEYSGVRPGEKLFEEFGFDAEKMDRTRHPKIFIGRLTPLKMETVEDNLLRLREVANETSDELVRRTLTDLVPGFAGSRRPAAPPVRAPEVAVPVNQNNLLDGAWSRLVELCRQRGFLGVGWRTFGVKPSDSRTASFNGNGHGQAPVKKTVPITPLAFVEMTLMSPCKAGKRAPKTYREAARDIEGQIGSELRNLYQSLEIRSANRRDS